jgi:glucose/arabinose dehydrogenase
VRVLALLLALATLVGLGGAASALPAEEGASTAARPALQRVGSFSSPTYVTAPPGDRRRLFVTERSGRIRVMRDGRRLATPFLDITARVQTSGESGLLSMAFAPDYERSRRFYVYYVDRGGNIRIDELRRSRAKPDRTERGSRRTVILQRHRRSNHKGGQLQFGPDGLLYMAFGDGGGEGDPDRNAQSLRTRLGKVLRIDPRRTRRSAYRIPRSNPFARRRGARREIYALGLRNPYRFSFDRLKGHLLIGDVGAAAVEEVDLVRTRRHRSAPRGGQNFGWSVFEGRRRLRAGNVRHHHRPALQRLHSQGVCSITGGYVIRDPALGRLRGRYVYGDLCDPRLRITGFRNGRARGDKRLGPSVERLVSFGEDARGRIYTVSLEGAVSRLVLR